LRYSRITEESIALSRIESGAIIIAGSGMFSGGCIRHHLKHNLWKKKNHVVIAGFQVNRIPGLALVDGAKTFHMGGGKKLPSKQKSTHLVVSQLMQGNPS
jgi:metallo-beta-lactamase family protein